MIIDETTPAVEVTTTGGQPVVPLHDRIRDQFAGKPELATLLNRADDFRDTSTAADAQLSQVMQSLSDRFHQAAGDGDALVKQIVGTYRGHVNRIAQNALSLVGKSLAVASDNFNRNMNSAAEAINATPVRFVADPNEVAQVNQYPPLVTFHALAADVAQANQVLSAAANSPADFQPTLGGVSPPPPANPPLTVDQAIAHATQYAKQIANLQAATAIPMPTAGGGSCTGDGGFVVQHDTVLNPPGGGLVSDPSYSGLTTSASPVVYAYQNGATITFSDTYPDPGGGGTDVLVTAVFPDGSSCKWQFIVVVYSPDQHPGPYDFQSIPSWPRGMFPKRFNTYADNPCTTTGGGSPPPPQPPPPPGPPPPQPPPPPPPGPPPPPPPPLDLGGAQCCPAPDPVRESFDPNIPVPGLSNAYGKENDWCSFINNISSVGGSLPAPDGTSPGFYTTIMQGVSVVSPTVAQLKKQLPAFMRWDDSPVEGSQTNAIIDTLGYNQNFIYGVAGQAGNGNATQLLAQIGLFNWAEKVIGVPMDYVAQEVIYAANYLLPRKIPDQGSIDSLYLTNTITDNEWECLTRSLGNLPGIFRKLRNNQIATPGVADQIELYMRGSIKFPDLTVELRKYGFLNDDDIVKLVTLRQQMPGLSDIIRFMVRDTENAKVVQDGKLDLGFAENFNGQLAQWATSQGISPDLAIRYWRAHWELPSPQMAYQFLQRLRPGRVDDSIATTSDDIAKLLEVNDYAPGWIPRMMAISYLTPTRADIRQGYVNGVYKKPEVLELLQDTGLSKDGAETVARNYDFMKEQRVRTMAARDGVWTIRNVLDYFIKGQLTRDDAYGLLIQVGMDLTIIDSALDGAEFKRAADMRAVCAKSIKRRYMIGSVTDKDASALLQQNQYDKVAADDLVAMWSCDRAARIQEIPAGKNLDWTVRGFLTLDQFAYRLKNLGYQDADINGWVAEAIARLTENATKQAMKNEKDALAKLKQQQKAAQDATKKAQADLKALQAQIKALQKANPGA